MRKTKAFTLAEVLITLGIIGVVAAITLPALITNIQEKVKEKRVQNIQQKFSKATDKMLSVSGLNGYGSSMEFVNELKNHLSIAKVCENNDLRSCWPTEKVLLDDGKEWEISKTTTGKSLKMTNDEYNDWDDTVGIITGDGTAMIFSYNKLCDIDPVKSSTWTADRSSSTACIAAVFDWNGSKKPNQYGTERADVLTLNAGGLGTTCVAEINGSCYGALQATTGYLTKAECEELADTGYGNKKSYCGIVEQDYWAWAVKQCGGVNKMIGMEDLAQIAAQIYGTTYTSWAATYNGSYNGTIAQSLGFPSSSGYRVWSNNEARGHNGNGVYYNGSWDRNFAGHSPSNLSLNSRGESNRLYLCKVE